MAGQVIMQGFVGFGIPLWLRRLLTMIPAVVVVFSGLNPSQSLFYSQVVLSLQLPFAIVPLIRYTSSRAVMGEHANRRAVVVLAALIASLIVVLNVVLVVRVLA